MLGVNLGRKAPPSTATTVPAAARRASRSTNPHLSVYADVFFFNIRSSPPPLLLPPQTQIIFESRLGAHEVLNDCRMTVDGTDFRIPQKGAVTKGNAFTSHKYAGYKLGVDILTGNWCMDTGTVPCR